MEPKSPPMLAPEYADHAPIGPVFVPITPTPKVVGLAMVVVIPSKLKSGMMMGVAWVSIALASKLAPRRNGFFIVAFRSEFFVCRDEPFHLAADYGTSADGLKPISGNPALR